MSMSPRSRPGPATTATVRCSTTAATTRRRSCPPSTAPTRPSSTTSSPPRPLPPVLEGSFFQTDVDINNAGAAMATYSFLWLPRGANNSDPAVSDSFTLAAGASVRYENVLAEVFGFEPDVAGALAISADSAFLGVMSRTYDVPSADTSPAPSVRRFPGIPASNLITQNETRRIIFMSENDDLRANLGCVNGVNDNVPIDDHALRRDRRHARDRDHEPVDRGRTTRSIGSSPTMRPPTGTPTSRPSRRPPATTATDRCSTTAATTRPPSCRSNSINLNQGRGFGPALFLC